MFNLLWKDVKELLNSKKRIPIVVSVLIILIIGTYLNSDNRKDTNTNTKVQFGVIDNDNSSYSKLLLDYFRNSESFSSYINIVQGDNSEIQTLFQQGKLDIYLEIPENFAENMIYLNHLPVKVLINTADATKAIVLKNILESYEKYISAVEINCVTLYDTMSLSGISEQLIEKKNTEISYDLIFTALGKESFFQYEETGDFPSTDIVNYYICALISIILIYSGLFVGVSILKEKKQGTLQRLQTAGVPIARILFEKILFTTFLIYIMIVVSYIIFTMNKSEWMNIKMALFYFAVVLFCVTLAILISGLCNNIQNYLIAGNFFVFILVLIGGSIIPIKYLPSGLSELSKFTPNYWFIKQTLLVQRGISNWEIIKIVVGILATVGLLYMLSIVTYSRKKVQFYE